MLHPYWRLIRLTLVCLVLVGLLAACGAAQTTPTPAATPNPTEVKATADAMAQEIATDYPLAATSWDLDSFGPPITSAPLLPDTRASVTYFWDRYVGYDGCNWFLGVYSATSDGELHMMEPLSSRAVCEPEDAYEQSLYFDGALLSATSYAHDGEQLTISTTGNQQLLTLSPASVLPMLGTQWDVKLWWDAKLDQWYPVIPTSTTTITFGKDGQAAGSGGCNNFTVSYEGDLQIEKVMEATDTYAELPALTFGPVSAQMAACTTPESIMEQEQAFFVALDSTAYYFKLGGMLLLLDAQGNPLIALAASS